MSIADEILAYVNLSKGDHVRHWGVKRRSGRYPWGSGEDPFQHEPFMLLNRARELQGEGLSDEQIAEKLGFMDKEGNTSVAFYRSALSNAYTSNPKELLAQMKTYDEQGLTEAQAAEKMGFTYVNGDASSTLYRRAERYAKHKVRQELVDQAQQLRREGKSLNEIAREMGYANDSSVRTLLNENTKSNKEKAFNIAKALKEEVDAKGAVDVGDKAELSLGCTKGTLEEALWILQTDYPDYVVEGIGVSQANMKGKRINLEVLHRPDISTRELYQDTSKIQQLGDFHTNDGGNTIQKLQYPASLDSSRVKVNYGDEGGKTKDGVIEIRPGVADLSLGDSHYAQVRILVDGTHYMKGMAMYNENLPDGVDVVFNTNKKSGTPMCGDKDNTVLKPIKVNEYDPNNPFGAAITAAGQVYYADKDGNQKLGVVNKLKWEGDWEDQNNNLSSQFLSKQPMKLINQQLNATYADYADQLAEIQKLENPTVRKAELYDFAGTCDSASVHLKAAALPRQKWQVILPIDELKNEDDDGYNEIYAPNFENGEKVALVRYPHAGTFEIPICTVNNNQPAAKARLGNATDAVGINSKVAERLSGADFDGDTVIVIPTGSNGISISTRGTLKGLINDDGSLFDPKTAYPHRDGAKVMEEQQKQRQMGVISNLITDMTLRGAPDDELARAVKHSMVVIDAPKHQLDYVQSEKDNGIAELKARWQEHYDVVEDRQRMSGASTLLSRRKQTVAVDERTGSPKIDPETGEVSYNLSGRTYKTDGTHPVFQQKDGTWAWKNKTTGEITVVDESKVQDTKAKTKIPIMEYVGDAYTLSSGTAQENAYAEYSNKMRELARQARKEYANTEDSKRDPEMSKKYAAEVESLNGKLRTAAANAPKERRAQALYNARMKAIKDADPELDSKHETRIAARLIEEARREVGASGKESKNFDITDREWEAIQNHAISTTNLRQIMRYADSTRIKQLAMPKVNKLTDAKIARIKALRNAGFTAAEIAKQTGVSTSTIYKLGT